MECKEVEVDVIIEGKSPLIMNKFTDAAIQAMSSGTSKVSVGDKPGPEAEAREHLHCDKKGNPVMPTEALFRCIVGAGAFIKHGRSKLTTMNSSKIPGMLFLEGTSAPIMERNGKGLVPARWTPQAYTPPTSTGARIVSWRPTFIEGWLIPFTIRVDTAHLPISVARELMEYAGRFQGLGSMRPQRKGQYGRFTVSHWEPKA